MVDTSFAETSNFDLVFTNEVNSTVKNLAQAAEQKISHGKKSLRYLGQQPLDFTGTDLGQLFELQDDEQGLKQKFIVSPRTYGSSSNRNGDGDGFYEFRPTQNHSDPYSSLVKVEKKQGKHASQFLLHFGNTSQPLEGQLTITVELNDHSEMISFDVSMLEVPIKPA